MTRHCFLEIFKYLLLEKLTSPLLGSQTSVVFALFQRGRVPHATESRIWLGIMQFRLSSNCMETPGVKCVDLGKIRFDNVQ